jgi:hypothetical protein
VPVSVICMLVVLKKLNERKITFKICNDEMIIILINK